MVAWIRKFRAESLGAGILALAMWDGFNCPTPVRSRASLPPTIPSISGRVMGGLVRSPAASDLYQAGQKAYRTGAVVLGSATADSSGRFTIKIYSASHAQAALPCGAGRQAAQATIRRSV